eukprot:TRINITY_DN22362_c0_g1_i1.p1 TRINITY_DN22362_c0_g1~~TRINITY_DN22362_c0_g1_i1.p1  ORF type:complete len:595 (+),score=151.48 TRINITY_DN22362_c0_g1_i1:35-1819(+)
MWEKQAPSLALRARLGHRDGAGRRVPYSRDASCHRGGRGQREEAAPMAAASAEASAFPCGPSAAALGQYAAEAHAFVSEYRWLHEVKFVEFFSGDCMAVVPEEWRDAVAEGTGTTERDVRRMIAGEVQAGWPDSLKKFVKDVDRLSLRRGGAAPAARRCEGLLARRLTPKKQHEVECAAALIDAACAACEEAEGARCGVVDVGAGQAFLPAMVAYTQERRVVAVEAARHNIERGRERNAILEKSFAKREKAKENTAGGDKEGTDAGAKKRPSPEGDGADLKSQRKKRKRGDDSQSTAATGLVSYLPVYLAPETTEEELMALLKTCGVEGAAAQQLCLTGLHACGDLTPLLLRLFASHDRFRCLVAVGCCYYKMAWPRPDGFPMSDVLQALEAKGSVIAATGAQLACGTPAIWATLPDAEWEAKIRISMNRALLEKVLYAAFPGSSPGDIGLRGIPKGKMTAGFAEYAAHALTRVKLRDGLAPQPALTGPADRGGVAAPADAAAPAPTPSTPTAGVLEQVEAEHTDAATRRGFVLWLTLRECVACVLEALFLADRVLYLQAAVPGCVVRAVPAFDAERSPRNVAIIATRNAPSPT